MELSGHDCQDRRVSRFGLSKSLRRARGGQAMVEYALIVVVIAIVVVAVLVTMGAKIANVFQNMTAALGH